MALPISTPNAPAALGPYSQAVRAGDTVYLSGQIPLDPKTGELVEGGFEAQVHQMAGNPYTESGEVFRIPDMLANRADIYNLGDVLTGREEAFALSYIENSLTSHPVTQPLAFYLIELICSKFSIGIYLFHPILKELIFFPLLFISKDRLITKNKNILQINNRFIRSYTIPELLRCILLSYS